jgi:hypothetical protein
MVQLVGGVTTVQLKLMALEEAAVAVSPIGADGTAAQVLLAFTVSVALLLVTEPTVFVTITLKSAPLSVATVAGVV